MKVLAIFKFDSIFANFLKKRAISSVGSEHLFYTQGVGGSNPSLPTQKKGYQFGSLFLFNPQECYRKYKNETTISNLARYEYICGLLQQFEAGNF